MSHIRNLAQRRLARLRRRQQREKSLPASRRGSSAFFYDASLRISGIGRHHDDIVARTGLVPKIVHLKGEPRASARHPQWTEDLWVLDSPLGERASLDAHAAWLWQAVRPHRAYFESLLAEASRADLWLGCLSESAFPVLGLDPGSLEIVRELKLGLAFNFTCV
jgi:hypothetical protein